MHNNYCTMASFCEVFSWMKVFCEDVQHVWKYTSEVVWLRGPSSDKIIHNDQRYFCSSFAIFYVQGYFICVLIVKRYDFGHYTWKLVSHPFNDSTLDLPSPTTKVVSSSRFFERNRSRHTNISGNIFKTASNAQPNNYLFLGLHFYITHAFRATEMSTHTSSDVW